VLYIFPRGTGIGFSCLRQLDKRGTMDITTSYTSASGSLPIKVLMNEDLVCSITQNKVILPVHVQLNPTNRCNLKCDWCSCSNRDKKLEMSREEIEETMSKYRAMGCKSVTITGGGEPLLHRDITGVMCTIASMGIDIGVVTNGWLVNNLCDLDWDLATWVRVSLGDGREKELDSGEYWEGLSRLAERDLDLSFSYVLTNKPDMKLIRKMINFANEHEITHIRMTTDIVQNSAIDTMGAVRDALSETMDDSRVIYQDRTTWTRGQEKCYISLLKPVVGADGKLYPCCGTQYFDESPSKNYAGCMGSIEDIDDIFHEQRMYDGSRCKVCYYSSYNKLIGKLLSDVKHKRFV